MLVLGQTPAWAFSLAGPIANNPNPINVAKAQADAWQVSVIGYGLAGDIEAPKNIGEGYRWNTPVLYYAVDANFLDFFGSNGVVAINQTFSILNSSLTNVDSYSTPLTEFPLNSRALNYSASALGLKDLKSTSMQAMMQELGLADPVRYVWTLHDRYLPSGAACPAYDYFVIQRNFDITASPLNQLQYSPYINGTLYTYYIQEECPASVPDPQAWAQAVIVDKLNFNPPVAAADGAYLPTTIPAGGYYVSLTRDDVAGLRYLLTTNYISFESPTPGAILLSSAATGGTNYGAPFPLFTEDLNTFVWASLTNSPLVLSNLYPGLIITSSSNNFIWQPTTNRYAYYTNLIGAPAGSQKLVTGQTITYSLVTNYYNTYGNIVTNSYRTNSTYTLVTIQAQQLNGAPAGTIVTNTSTSTVNVPNVPSGDFYINTNTCGPNLVLSVLATNVVTITNLSLVATNASGTNLAGLYYSQTVIAYATNHILLVEPIICGAAAVGGSTTNAPGLYQGIGWMQFTNASYDSLLGQYFQPITNTYGMHLITNGKLINQTFQRVITTPDIVFSAADISPGPADNLGGNYWRNNPNFDQANALPGLAGPGTINPAISIGFNKAGPTYVNFAGWYELNQIGPFFAWGSFDGTTNDPIVYPNGTSIANLANQVLVQIVPAALPNGTNGVAYPIQSFGITGGAFTPPYTWSLAAGSGGLPPGLALNPNGTITSPTSNVTPGTPTLSGTFDFTLQLTDALARSIQWTYSITIQ